MFKLKKIKSSHKYLLPLSLAFLGCLFLCLRLIKLTSLPIFADEAIYLRWSQLIISDWQRYLFFPLNDGKTPLQMWLMIPFLKLLIDPLWAGRFLSVLFGLGQVLLMWPLMGLFTQKRKVKFLAVLLTIFLPGLILTNRLAIIDTQLTFFLSATFYFAYLSLQQILNKKITNYKIYFFSILKNKNFYLAILSFSLALLTKFSALLFIGSLASLIFYFWPKVENEKTSKKVVFWVKKIILISLPLAFIVIGGLSALLLLKISPAFPQLFSRGGDFLYSLKEFGQQPLIIMQKNFQLLLEVFSTYLTSILFFSSLFLALYFWGKDKRPAILISTALLFALPIIGLGKIIYPRYFLPALPFFVLSFTLSLSYFQSSKEKIIKSLLLILFFIFGGSFTLTNIFLPEKMLLPAIDQQQYLSDWSSGYGITETIDYLQKLPKTEQTLVLTEGYFGTLPDALLTYLFKEDVSHLRIEGIGQPVNDLSKAKKEWLDQYPHILLVVNSHRFFMDLPKTQLLKEFPRPIAGAPSLQIWQIK